MAETFLSDVHIYTDNKEWRCLKEHHCVVSRFEFVTKQTQANAITGHNSTLEDEDGDLILARKVHLPKDVINIYHAMATTLPLVGLQVWRGALLLADYLIYSGDNILKDKVVMELGAGTGLCSIVAALTAHHVFATDTGDSILNLCHKNCIQNGHISGIGGHMAQILIRELDWKQPLLFPYSVVGAGQNKTEICFPGAQSCWLPTLCMTATLPIPFLIP